MKNVDAKCRIYDLIASIVRFDRFHRCLSFFTVVLVRLYLSSYTRAVVCINAYSFLKMYC